MTDDEFTERMVAVPHRLHLRQGQPRGFARPVPRDGVQLMEQPTTVSGRLFAQELDVPRSSEHCNITMAQRDKKATNHPTARGNGTTIAQ